MSKTVSTNHLIIKSRKIFEIENNEIKDSSTEAVVHGEILTGLSIPGQDSITGSKVSEFSKIPKSLFEKQFRIVRILSQNPNVFK